VTATTTNRIMKATALLSAGALLLGACSSSPKKAKKKAASTTTTTKAPVCALTGAPSPLGAIPQRTAIAAKIDNYQDARPQSGLDKTDIVFEEPVEGGITRYNAIFQCDNADSIGPIRSARQIDIGILGQLGNPPLVHVGGINPVLENIVAAGIPNLDLGNYPGAITHLSTRYAPYNTYTSTTQLYANLPAGTKNTPPAPIYTYSPTTPAGTAVTSVHVPFSGNSDVTWTWAAGQNAWLRFYNGTNPDKNADGVQNQAANVIIQTVHVTFGPWLENAEGGLEVQAVLSGTSGPAIVFRNGIQVNGTWSRDAASSPTVFKDAAGTVIQMAPGRTWVELVPDTVAVTAVPNPVQPTTTTTIKKK
jgi:hypothetical protein